MKVILLQGPPSCGKTTTIINEMAEKKGLYLFALPRIGVIKEKMGDLERRVSEAGTNVVIRMIHSDGPKTGSISHQIEEARLKLEEHEHAVLMVTHEGLMGTDLSGYSKWKARIDEIPAAVASGKLTLGAMAAFLEKNYDLDPIGVDNWSSLTLKSGASTLSCVLSDSVARAMAQIHKLANRPGGVLLNVSNWGEVSESKKQVEWFSAWTLTSLKACQDVVLAAASYEISLLHHVTEALAPGAVEIETKTITLQKTPQCRFLIHYFTKGHRGSTSYWGDFEKGGLAMKIVGRHLQSQKLGFWSGNKVVREQFQCFLDGEHVSPRQEGTNSLMKHTSCAFIYSSKMLPQDEIICKLADLSPADVERAREHEDIYQFVMRGAARDPEFAGDYKVFLYSLDQAEMLARLLATNGITSELVPIETEMMELVRTRRSKESVVHLSNSQKQEQKKARNKAASAKARAKKKAANIAAGTHRLRGRPAKSSIPPAYLLPQELGADASALLPPGNVR